MLLLPVALALLAATPPVAAGPLDVVKDVYARHFAHQQRWDLTAREARSRFAPALLALLDADDRAAAATPDEIVGLDFDPLTNAQEEAEAWTPGSAQVTGTTAAVPVELRTGTQTRRVTVRLVAQGQQWRIADLDYGETTLVRTLEQLAAERRRK